MEKVEINVEHIVTGGEHSSKGNQLKWEQDGYWYKADAFGFESLAETVVSGLLRATGIGETVIYEPVNIIYKGKQYRGCRSRNFRSDREELIPLERLSRTYTGFGLAKELAHIADVKQRILHTVELVENITGLEGFGIYLTKMLEIDAFFLNEDRHTNNIALLYDMEKKEYRFCPFFDMGLSLFSDTREAYPFEKTTAECRTEIKAKPFSRDFDEQLDAANELYGCHLKFGYPGRSIINILEAIPEYRRNKDSYLPEEITRVEEVLRNQAGKYQYMFQN